MYAAEVHALGFVPWTTLGILFIWESCANVLSQRHSNLTGQLQSHSRLCGSDKDRRRADLHGFPRIWKHVSPHDRQTSINVLYTVVWFQSNASQPHNAQTHQMEQRSDGWGMGVVVVERSASLRKLTCAGSWRFGWWRRFLRCSSGRRPSVAGCMSRYVSGQWSPWENHKLQ